MPSCNACILLAGSKRNASCSHLPLPSHPTLPIIVTGKSLVSRGGSSYPSSYSSFSLILLVAPDLSVSSPIFKHPYTDLSSTGTMISLGRYGSCLRGYSATTPWVSFKYHPFSWPGSDTLREQSVTADWVLG